MFSENDYPDWVDEMYNYCGSNVQQFDLDSEVWEQIKENDKPPHIGNAIVSLLFDNMIEYLVKDILDEGVKNKIVDLFEPSINAIATRLYFDGESYDDIDELEEAVENKIKELVDE